MSCDVLTVSIQLQSLYESALQWSKVTDKPLKEEHSGVVYWLDPTTLGLDYADVLAEIPDIDSVTSVSILAGPLCVTARFPTGQACQAYGEGLKDYLASQLPTLSTNGYEGEHGVTFKIITSTAAAVSRMILSRLLICPPHSPSCLLPSAAKRADPKTKKTKALVLEDPASNKAIDFFAIVGHRGTTTVKVLDASKIPVTVAVATDARVLQHSSAFTHINAATDDEGYREGLLQTVVPSDEAISVMTPQQLLDDLSISIDRFSLNPNLHPAHVVDHHKAWCPSAMCQDSDLCYPCQRRFLIEIATGRSASTTLMYMLDALPGVRMSGENKNELNAIRHMIDNFKPAEAIEGPWKHNQIPPGSYSCAAQRMIETINPPVTTVDGTVEEDDSNTIVGFKTIRLLENVKEGYEEKEMVKFITEMFPCARIVINIRSDVEKQEKSQKLAFNSPKSPPMDVDGLRKMNDRLRNIASIFGEERAYLIDSSEWMHDIDNLNELVEWLGFDRSCFFQDLLEFNTHDRYGNGKTKLELDPNCRYVGA